VPCDSSENYRAISCNASDPLRVPNAFSGKAASPSAATSDTAAASEACVSAELL